MKFNNLVEIGIFVSVLVIILSAFALPLMTYSTQAEYFNTAILDNYSAYTEDIPSYTFVFDGDSTYTLNDSPLSYSSSATIDYILTDKFMIRGNNATQYLLVSTYASSQDPDYPTTLPITVNITGTTATVSMSDTSNTSYTFTISYLICADGQGDYCYTTGDSTHYVNKYTDIIYIGGNTSTYVIYGYGNIDDFTAVALNHTNTYDAEPTFVDLTAIDGVKDVYTFTNIGLEYGHTATYDRIFLPSTVHGMKDSPTYSVIGLIPIMLVLGLVISISAYAFKSRWDEL